MKCTALIVLIYVGLLGDDPKIQADQDRLQGEWNVVACQIGSRESDGAKLAIFEGDQFFLSTDGERPKVGLTFKIDPAATPRTIDMDTKGANPWHLFGVYKFEEDRLILCYNTRQRPTDFNPKARVQEPYNCVFTLEKKAGARPDASPPRDRP